MVIVLRDGVVSIAYDDGCADVYVVDPSHDWVVSTRWMATVAMPDSIEEISKDVAYLLHAAGYEFQTIGATELDEYFDEENWT